METEQEKQDRFTELVGGTQKADRLQAIWNNSYPHGTEYDKLRGTYISKEEDFRKKAKGEGYTEQEIKAFLAL